MKHREKRIKKKRKCDRHKKKEGSVKNKKDITGKRET